MFGILVAHTPNIGTHEIVSPMKKRNNIDEQIVIYQSKSGAIELRSDAKKETLWATQVQIVDLFGVDQSVISRHIRNIFNDGEIDRKSNMQKMHNANSDKPVAAYSLDVVLSVGYRTNSRVAIDFRKWATKTLRRYITDGYVINKRRITQNYEQFLEAVNNIKQLLPAGASIDTASVLDLVSMFADTWLSLNAYDKDTLITKGSTKKHVALTAEKLIASLRKLKTALMQKGEATEMFGQERQAGSVSGIVGNVMQSFDGKEMYDSVEEKAAHLLYFMVKNHPFIDGNKRSGGYAFVWFLSQANILDISSLTSPALTALTILVAQSEPKEKEKMINLILTLLKKTHRLERSPSGAR